MSLSTSNISAEQRRNERREVFRQFGPQALQVMRNIIANNDLRFITLPISEMQERQIVPNWKGARLACAQRPLWHR